MKFVNAILFDPWMLAFDVFDVYHSNWYFNLHLKHLLVKCADHRLRKGGWICDGKIIQIKLTKYTAYIYRVQGN